MVIHMDNEFRFLNVRLTFNERAALYQLAGRDRREARDEAAILIRDRLIAAGMLDESGSMVYPLASVQTNQRMEAQT